MSLVSPALNRAVLHALAYTSVERGHPISEAWRALLEGLSQPEAEELPRSIGLVLRLLAPDEERLRLVTDMCVTFDLYEVVPYLLELLGIGKDGPVALAAAALAPHPGVPRGTMARVAGAPAATDLSGARRRAFDLRLDPTAPAESDLDHLLRVQRWPGVDESRYRRAPIAPLVAVGEEGIPAVTRWRLLLALHERGAAVRRIPARWEQTPAVGWLASSTPVIATSSKVLDELRGAGQDVTGGQLVLFDTQVPEERSIRRALEDVSALLAGRGLNTLHRVEEPRVATPSVDVLHESVFRLGTYTAAEMAYLSGGSSSSVYRWARRLDELQPRDIQSNYYWRFDQLVGLRAYRYLQSYAEGRIPPDVIRDLVRLSGRPEGMEVVVTRSGTITVVESDEQMYDLRSQQGVIPDVVRVTDTFGPFPLGGRRPVPGLLKPSERTTVHPRVLGGTPSIRARRISCRSLVRLADAHGRGAVRTAYPEVDEATLNDGIRVGRDILNGR